MLMLARPLVCEADPCDAALGPYQPDRRHLHHHRHQSREIQHGHQAVQCGQILDLLSNFYKV